MYMPLERDMYLPLKERCTSLLKERCTCIWKERCEKCTCLWMDRCSSFSKEIFTCLSKDMLASRRKLKMYLPLERKMFLPLKRCTCVWKKNDVLASERNIHLPLKRKMYVLACGERAHMVSCEEKDLSASEERNSWLHVHG